MFLLLVSTIALANNVSQQIYERIADPRFSSANISISVRSVADGTSIFPIKPPKHWFLLPR